MSRPSKKNDEHRSTIDMYSIIVCLFSEPIHMFFGIPGKTYHPEAPDREYLDALTLTVRAEVRTEYPTEIVSGMS